MRPAKTQSDVRRRKVCPSTAIAAAIVGSFVLVPSPSAAAEAAPPDQVALSTLDEIVRGDYPAASADFNPTMQSLLPVQALQQSWDLYQQAFGAYLSHGVPENVQRDDITVVNVPLQMARRPGQFRVSVQPDGTLSALTFLREGVPVP
ncbi:DUF3887 domain-containing protein [Mycolicibacterium sp. P9-22]|uniref:DUF3887 domain-containing protein n=1 Tax=Mycolicibacterium sp. P9-22 TaxID=2024613 RepID=UPI0011EC9D9C|nr:DUF3887 domain-containing protein [Mycolicibacterium sp. P9-22]KAA0115137.1 DUF3887 domain-containing protein [Mycolicibacterium sp. P9-22]